MEKNKPTDPSEEAPAGTPKPEEGQARGKASVSDLLAAARGDVPEPDRGQKLRGATPVTPEGAEAGANVRGESAPAGDSPNKQTPSGSPVAARVSPASGASKTTSTPTAAVNKGVSKAVASKAPSGPVIESVEDPPVNKLRRRVVWASVASFLGVSFLMFVRFFLPRTITEPSNQFRIGYPGDYSFGVDDKWQQQYRIWVVRNSERLFVISAVCTHLGCTPDWKASENKFKCPCHGSGYDSEGINFEGPAPRPMDRAHVELDAEGQIVVNTGMLYDWQKGGENNFEKEGAFIRV